MVIYRDINKIESKSGTAVAMGTFDGIHLGHREVISQVRGTPYVPSVFTFSENPAAVLKGGVPSLMTQEDKAYYISEMGILNLFSVDFKSVMNMDPEEFFREILIKRCRAEIISCGEDFRFGKNAAGNTDMLRELCAETGVELRIVPPVTIEGERISSTAIRAALAEGNAQMAAELLGRPFSFSLPVVTGNKIGRTLGTPTINQILPKELIKPKFGVYAVIVHIGREKHWGVCNIGVKPTIGKYDPLAETWIGEFEGDLYGSNLRVEVLDFIRPEKKFDSLDELKDEIFRNAETARKTVEKFLSKGR